MQRIRISIEESWCKGNCASRWDDVHAGWLADETVAREANFQGDTDTVIVLFLPWTSLLAQSAGTELWRHIREAMDSWAPLLPYLRSTF